MLTAYICSTLTNDILARLQWASGRCIEKIRHSMSLLCGIIFSRYTMHYDTFVGCVCAAGGKILTNFTMIRYDVLWWYVFVDWLWRCSWRRGIHASRWSTRATEWVNTRHRRCWTYSPCRRKSDESTEKQWVTLHCTALDVQYTVPSVLSFHSVLWHCGWLVTGRVKNLCPDLQKSVLEQLEEDNDREFSL